ncbi:MAG: LamG-like jellyroll fold domain-containing protein, partial [Planctomycetota bacterium]
KNAWKDYWLNPLGGKNGAEVFLETDPNYTNEGNSVEYFYRNFQMQGPNPVGSEAVADTNDLEIGSDWTAAGVKALVLYFHGDTSNGEDPHPNYTIANDRMWVAVEDANANVGIVRYADMNDIKEDWWHEWNIDLTIFDACGISLTDVKKVYIGFGGLKGGATSKYGAGYSLGGDTVWFDDIRLYPPRCITEKVPADFTGDCITDPLEVSIMATDWLITDFEVMPEAPSSANLLVEYLFDGGSDDYNDSSGAPYYHGIASTFATTSGGHLTLDGVSYVDIPFGAANPFDGSQDFSIAMSFKTTQPGMLISSSKADPCDVTEAEYDRAMSVYPIQGPWLGEGVDSGDVVYENNYWNRTWSDPLAAVLDDQWHHMVVTYDADGGWSGFDPTGLFKVYLDGAPPSQDMSGDPNIPNIHLDTVRIGDTFNPDIEAAGITEFVGEIDDVRIYDYPLTLANAQWLAGEVNDVYFGLDSAANLVPKTPDEQTYDANNPDIVNFIDYGLLADNWLAEQLWP